MKRFFLFVLLLNSTLVLQAQDELNIMTFNIRYDTKDDGDNAWQYRKDKVSSQILFNQAHIVCIQEALANQVQDLQRRLTKYSFVGIGREGNDKGEYSAIFYDKDRFRLLQSKTFWLSEIPEAIGKKGWDASLPRIVTWARFRDKRTGKAFFVFNTHFDHKGMVSQKESSRLLLRKVKDIARKQPVIITGDFNAFPSDDAIKILRDISNPDHFQDAKANSLLPHYGPDGTFNEFGSKEIHNLPLDYIFYKNDVVVLRHGTLSQTWGGKFSSDHFPLLATVLVK